MRTAGTIFADIARDILDGRTESTEHFDDLTRLERKYTGREAEFCAVELSMRMWAFPRHFCHAVRDHRLVSIRSSRRSSKTYTLSGLIPAMSFASPSVIVSTSASDRQVKDVLWSKVRTHVMNAPGELPCTLNQAELRISTDRFALGFSTNSEGAAIEASPVLAITLICVVGGIGGVAWLFLRYWRATERERSAAELQRMETVDVRHKEYFAQLERMSDAQNAATDRGTVALKEAAAAHRETAVVLSSVQEILRERRA